MASLRRRHWVAAAALVVGLAPAVPLVGASDVLVDEVPSGLSGRHRCGGSRRMLARRRPRAERLFELLRHRSAIEITRDREHEVLRSDIAAMERRKVVLRDAFDRSRGRPAVAPVFVAAREPAPLALLDRRRLIVALLQRLECLLAAELQTIGFPRRSLQALDQQCEPIAQILRQQIDRRTGFRGSEAG